MAVYKKDKSKWTKDGRCWGFRCYYTDMYGNRKQKESKLYHTKKEAIEAEILFLSKSETEDTIDNNVLFTVAYNDYLNYKKRTLKMTTYYSVEKRLNKYICSYFENYKLLSITSNTVNRFIDLLSTKKLDIKYQNSIIGYLKEFLVFCSDNYNFDRKIANKIIKHRIDTPKSVKRDVDWNFWTYDEFVTFINCVDDEFYNFMFWFLYYTGLRLGEMISLTWKDVDFEKGTIKIENNFTNKLGMGMYKIITKSTSSTCYYFMI